MSLNLFEVEEEACKGETRFHQWLCELVTMVRNLQHEIANPNYHYSGRIHRQAILVREARIDRLNELIKEQDALIEALKKQLDEFKHCPRDLQDRS